MLTNSRTIPALVDVSNRNSATVFVPRAVTFTSALSQAVVTGAGSVAYANALMGPCAFALGTGSPTAPSMASRVTVDHFERFPLEKSSENITGGPEITVIGSDGSLGVLGLLDPSTATTT